MASTAAISIAIGRAMFALAAMLLPATLIAAVPADPGNTNPSDTLKTPFLAGRLLVATPAMRDPRFDHAVILMVRHDKDGAFGIVINRPIGERSLASVLAALGDKDSAATGNVRIFLGGPVQPEIGFVVHSTDYRLDETIAVDAHVAVTSSPKVLRDIADKKGPSKSLTAFGYAGWAPGQLEGELERNVWYTAPQDPGVVFDDDRDKLWDHATAHRTQDL
jgi:putative transcriptional regulator